MGIKGTLGDIDPLNKVPLKRARSRVQKGYPLRGLPNTTVCVCVRVLLPTWSVLYEVCKQVPSQSEALCMGAFLSLLRYDDHAVADAKTIRV